VELYVKTSVWNIRVDEEEVNQPKRRITESFFAEAATGRHRLFISTLVLLELAVDPDETHREVLEDSVRRSPLAILEQTEDVLRLGREYVRRGIVPARYDDAGS